MLKKLLYLFIFLFLVGAGIGYWAYGIIFNSNTNFEEEVMEIKIPRNSGYEDVYKELKDKQIILDYASFDRVAQWMKYKRDRVPSGNFEIKRGSNNRQIVGKLRSGIQEPIDITFNNVRSLAELAGIIDDEISLDSLEILEYFSDSVVLAKMGYNIDNILSLFIPNTYRIYWDIGLEDLAQRMQKEHDAFWNKMSRKEKAAELGYVEHEVYTLASIVEKESQSPIERPIIAGLYLNRLEKGIFLQADPTVVFANGDFGLRRVLNKHLAIDSPYNTYRYPGLPPGPIYMPSIQSIDAVLNPEKHDYIFMCAKPGFSSEHAFAKTLRGHAENARNYHSWLSEQQIR